MDFLIDIRTDNERTQSFRVEAESESQAIERLKLRLHPAKRDNLVVDSIKIDMTTVGDADPYGVYSGE